MSIESILEHQPFGYAVTVAEITTSAGSAAATIGGIGGYAALTAGDLIRFTDDAGTIRTEQIASKDGDPNITLENPAQSLANDAIVSKISTGSFSQYFFRADNSLLKSGIVTIGPNKAVLGTPGSVPQTKINANEGILLKTLYLRFPYQYTMSGDPIKILFMYYTAGNVFYQNVQTVGENGRGIFIPVENVEIPVNAFIPPPPGLKANWQLVGTIEQGVLNTGVSVLGTNGIASVSNVSAPDVLNGQILPVTLGVRIFHAETALSV